MPTNNNHIFASYDYSKSAIEKSAHYTKNSANLNLSISNSIFNFINGESNLLPKYEIIDRIFNLSNSNVISEGMGVLVSIEKALDGSCYVLAIDIEKPINSSKSRVDKITPEIHSSYLKYRSKTFDLSKNTISIKVPEYNPKRVEILKQYVSGYTVKKEIKGVQKKNK